MFCQWLSQIFGDDRETKDLGLLGSVLRSVRKCTQVQVCHTRLGPWTGFGLQPARLLAGGIQPRAYGCGHCDDSSSDSCSHRGDSKVRSVGWLARHLHASSSRPGGHRARENCVLQCSPTHLPLRVMYTEARV